MRCDLFASFLVVKDDFTQFARLEWTKMSSVSIAYFGYWTLALIVLLCVFIYMVAYWIYRIYKVWRARTKLSKHRQQLDRLDYLVRYTGPEWLDIGMEIMCFIYSPFLLVVLAEYVVANLVCRRRIIDDLPETLFGRLISLIAVAVSSVGGLFPAIYLYVLAAANRLQWFDGLVLTGVSRVGTVALLVACGQWTVYKSVKSENFFKGFAIAREQRGAAVKLRKLALLH